MVDHESDTIAANRTLGSAFFKEQDRLRGGPAEHLCTLDYMATIGGSPPMSRAGHEAFAVGFYTGFPDAIHQIEDVFATSDRVAVRFVIQGTHTGNFFGIPATGRSMRAAANVLLRVSEGRVSTLTAVFDEAGVLRQLGVLP